jgi:hypothetical protein
MSAEIFQFSTAPRRSTTIKTSTRVGEDIGDDLPEEIEFRSPGWKARKAAAANRSATAINSDLRKERRDVWRAAEALTRYWRTRFEFESAASMSSLADSPEGRKFYQDREQWPLDSVAKWREALMAQLLTPAPDTGAITWKRATLEAGQHRFTDTSPKKIERAIADDLEWLAAHPTKRTGNVEACAKRRAFKEAMKQRIREIAASLNLSDIQIKPALKLKHEEIGRFCETHGVNLGWLLEGVGPMFKPWPTS